MSPLSEDSFELSKLIGLRKRGFLRYCAWVTRISAIFLDALILLFLGVWLVGGIPWGEHVLLPHGADPRRAAILLILIAAAFPKLRARSRCVGWARGLAVKLSSANKQGRLWRRVLLVLAAGVACAFVVAQAYALRFPLFDVGIFHQLLWNLSRGNGFYSPVSAAPQFLSDHFVPSLALLSPVYWILGSWPPVIAVLHVALLFAGVAAWVYLAGHWPGRAPKERATLAAATLVFGTTFESLWANLQWGFHENALAFAALSWAIALGFSERAAASKTGRDQNRLGGFRATPTVLLLIAVAAGSKEILLVTVAFGCFAYAVVIAPRARQGFRKAPFFWAVFAGAALLACFFVFQQMPRPEGKNYFDRYYSYLGSSASDALRTLVLNPWNAMSGWVSAVGFTEAFLYFVRLLVPFLFFPALLFFVRPQSQSTESNPSPGWLVWAVLPSAASAVLATYAALRNPKFHYVLEIWPVFLVLTLAAIVRLSAAYRRIRLARLAWAWAVVGALLWGSDPVDGIQRNIRIAMDRAELRRALESIPKHASVTADEEIGYWISGRREMNRAQDRPERMGEWVVIQSDAPAPQSHTLVWKHERFSAYRQK